MDTKGFAAVVITFGLIVRIRSNEEETNQVRQKKKRCDGLRKSRKAVMWHA